jgi:WD40 repeat protein
VRQLSLLVIAGVVFANSWAEAQDKAGPTIWSDKTDAYGDPLPLGAVARIGTVRYRLERDSGLQPTLSPDGKLLAVPSMNAGLELRELPGWTKTRTITVLSVNKKNVLQIQNVAFSRDSKQIVVVDQGRRELQLVNLATGASVKSITLPAKQVGDEPFLMVSQDQQTVVYSYCNRRVKQGFQEFILWDLAKDKFTVSAKIPLSRHGDGIQPAVSPDARRAAQITTNRNAGGRREEYGIEIWDLTTGKSERKIETEAPMQHVAFSPEGKWLAASNGNSLLRIYEVATGKEKHNIRLRRAGTNHVEFSSDGKALYLADTTGVIVQFDPVSGERVAEHKGPIALGAHQLAILPDGKLLALAQQADAFHFWDATGGKLFSPVNVPMAAISDVGFSAGGELFVASGDGDSSWWNPRTAAKLRDIKLEFADNLIPDYSPRGRFNSRGYRGDRFNLTLSRTGAFMLGSLYGGATLFDAKTGKLLFDDDAANGNDSAGAGAAVFFDADRKLAAASGKKIRVWDPRTGRDLAQFDLPLRDQEFVSSLAVSSTGKSFGVLCGNDQNQGQSRFVLLDADKKQVVREGTTQNRAETLEFSPDDRWLAVSNMPHHVRLVRIGQPHGDHDVDFGTGFSEITQLAFSPDGRQLACACVIGAGDRDSSRIFICEVASMKVRMELQGHPSGLVQRLAFSRDGGLLASGATDTTALVWHAGLRAFTDSAHPEFAKDMRGKEATATEQDDWFQKLAGSDARVAFQAMVKLARRPTQAVKLLETKIVPAQTAPASAKAIAVWIQNLGSSQFAVRGKATQALQELGPTAEPELRAAWSRATDVEAKRRLGDLLDRIAYREWTADELRQARAVEVLETIASPEARAVLMRWSGGDPGAVLTTEARKALAQVR